MRRASHGYLATTAQHEAKYFGGTVCCRICETERFPKLPPESNDSLPLCLTSHHTLRDYTSDPEFQLGSVDGDDAPASATPQSGAQFVAEADLWTHTLLRTEAAREELLQARASSSSLAALSGLKPPSARPGTVTPARPCSWVSTCVPSPCSTIR